MVREDVAGAEYVTVRVAGIRRQLEVRLFGVGVRSGDQAYLALCHRAAAPVRAPLPDHTSAGM